MVDTADPNDTPAELLGTAIAALGTQDFCPALTAWLRAVVPYTFTVVFGYQGDNRPIEIHDDFPQGRRKVFVSDYVEGPYLLDPFFLSAVCPVPPGLYRLRDLAPDRFYQGEYFRNYYMRTEIAEEIGYFAHVPGDAHVVLSLMREDKIFSQPEFRRLSKVSPIVTALMAQHWSGLAEVFATHATQKPELTGHGLDRLTAREREIVGYVLKGHSAEATGQALGIASGTVRIHRRNIYAKLGISSQRELFARFMDSVA